MRIYVATSWKNTSRIVNEEAEEIETREGLPA